MDATTTFPIPDFGYGGGYGAPPNLVKDTLGNPITSFETHNGAERPMASAPAGVSDFMDKKDQEYRDPLNNFMMWNSQYMMPVEPSSNVDDMMGYLEQSEPEADDDDEEDEDITDFNPPTSHDFSPSVDELENDPFFVSMQHTHRPSLEISCNAAHAAQLGLRSTDSYHQSPPYNCIDPSTLQLRSLAQPIVAQNEDPLEALLASRPLTDDDDYDVPAEDDIPQLEPLPIDKDSASRRQSDTETSGDDEYMDVDTSESSPAEAESEDSAYSPAVSSNLKNSRRSRKVLHGPHRCEMTLPGGGACHKSFTRPYDLARHQETIHAQVRKMYTCEKCGENSKTFSRMDALSRHLRIKHPKN